MLFIITLIIIIILCLTLVYLITSYTPLFSSDENNQKFNNKLSCQTSSNYIGPPYKHFCPKQSSSNPTIFGPPTWYTLHIMAENYPKKPDKNHKKGCLNFVKGLPYMLPCPYCGYHLKKDESDVDLKKCCESRKSLRQFFLDAHNKVNVHEEKPLWSESEAEDYYSMIPACLNNKVFILCYIR